MALKLMAALALAASAGASTPAAPVHHLVRGSVYLDYRGPDGNSLIIDAPEGLIVVDTGRHPDHARKLLAFAAGRGRPIAAIVNTHWHLDHTTGNLDLRQTYPSAEVYGTNAIEGALTGFLGRNRAAADKLLADPSTPAGQEAQILRGRSRIDNPDSLRPTRTVRASSTLQIAGRRLDVRVAPFAATEADLWIYDAEARLAVVGDLVVDIVPFMDTACPEGWLQALEEIERTPFEWLIPGHGPMMDRTGFAQWKAAFEAFVACGRSDSPVASCVAGWERDAAGFIPPGHRQYVREAADYYIGARLRSSPEERQRYCKPLEG